MSSISFLSIGISHNTTNSFHTLPSANNCSRTYFVTHTHTHTHQFLTLIFSKEFSFWSCQVSSSHALFFQLTNSNNSQAGKCQLQKATIAQTMWISFWNGLCDKECVCVCLYEALIIRLRTHTKDHWSRKQTTLGVWC